MNRFRILLRRGVLLATVIFALLICIVSWNCFWFQSKQLKRNPALKLELDTELVLGNLQRAIQIASVSSPMSRLTSDSELLRFRNFLEQTYPTLHDHPFISRTGADLGDAMTPSVLLEWPGNDIKLPGILLMSHFDVVPVEPLSIPKWSLPPFSGQINEGYIWGRGTLDCKHGVIAILEAVRKLHEAGYQPERTVYIALGHDEEIGGVDGNQKIADWFRSQGKRLHVIIDEGGCIFADFPGLSRPVALVGVAEKGFVNVDLSVNMTSEKIGHASMPPSETAIGILSRAVHGVESNPFPSHSDRGLRDTLNYIGPEMPSLTSRIAMSNMWLFSSIVKRTLSSTPSGNAMLRTTIAPTVIEGGGTENVLPGHATATLNLRLMPGDSIEEALKHLGTSINDSRVTITPRPRGKEASPFTKVESEAFAMLQTTIHEIFPEVVVAPFVLVGGTDTGHYIGLTENILRFIPARLSQRDTQRLHGIDERISQENFVEIVRFFHQFIKNASGKATTIVSSKN
jgi:carboxypeptidase PM20D1